MPQASKVAATIWDSPWSGGPAGRHLQVATIAGAAEALREAMGSPVAPVERAIYERMLAALRGRIDDAGFVQAWAEGRAMALDDWTRMVDSTLGE